MKKFSNATLAAIAQHPRVMARLVLAFVASVLVVLLGLMAMSSGPNGATVFAQATESPTPTPADTGPAVKLLNPSQAYDPKLLAPPRPPNTPDPPKISDKFDGVDELYHVVAVTRNAPANSTIEAYFQPNVGLEMTVGILTPVAGQPDTWEMFWDIPNDMLGTSGTFKVVLFAQGPAGFEEIASDETAARVDRSEETAEFSWPSQAGPLGFHKPKGGFWRTVVEGTVSSAANRVIVSYSATPIGEAPEFTRCAYVSTGAVVQEGVEAFAASCALAGKTLPSEVTSIAVIAIEDDSSAPVAATDALTQDSADVHRVQPYVQDVAQMTVELEGMRGANGESTDANYPTGRRRTAMREFDPEANPFPTNCLKFQAIVRDHLGRPVQGANLDAHIVGPSDQVGFGSDFNTGTSGEDSLYKSPDKSHESKETSRYCFDDPPGPPDDERGTEGQEEQGEHNVPGGPDIKHAETAVGTGLDPPSGATAFKFGPGQSRFFIFSFQPGFTDLTVWVDEEPLVNEATAREADDDLPEPTEPSASIRAQWLPAPLTLRISPQHDSAPVGECNKYTVRARAGNAVVPNINVDVHAGGPNNDLDFCDPGDGTPRRAPDKPTGETAHQVEDEGESSHSSASPETPQEQHTEGETDDAGNFVFGITSTATGASQITAWVDGEKDQDDDVLDEDEEVSATASKSWAASAQDAQVRFVNPSGYGGSGDNVSNRRDADGNYHIVARVDLPDVVPGVEFFISSDDTVFTKIGDGTRVGDSDTWELFWPVTVPDGAYTLRAQIIGTDKREDRAITVNNEDGTGDDPTDVAYETAEITRPLDAGSAPFDKGATTVEGVASAGARGVTFYYTTTAASEVRDEDQWVECGEVTLPGADVTQNFKGSCALQDPDDDGTRDAAADVTGIAALTFICDPVTGCTPAGGQVSQSGDAHRVFGFEANPVVTIEPAEAAGQTAQCQRFEMSVKDAAGLGIANVNVDIHLSGPTDSAGFCDLADGDPRQAPDRAGHAASPNRADQGTHQEDGSDTHHTEGETGSGGRFVFGITSDTNGDSQLVAWADQDDNDELDANEKSDTSIMHWGRGDGGGNNSRCTIEGDSEGNVLRGTSGDDVICGGGGDDTIRGGGGDDVIYGGGGHDNIRGNAGNDKLYGGRGIDILRGGSGADLARGNGQNDTIRGYNGKDRLFGGGGNDLIAGGRHRDFMRGNAGRDTLNGGPGRDNCNGGRGRDSVSNC